jgi:hypothetical protein
MTDDRDFIERAKGISRNWTGEEFSDDRLVHEFHLYGHAKRAEALDQFDAELASQTDIPLEDAERVFRLQLLRGSLGEVHHSLRKAGR